MSKKSELQRAIQASEEELELLEKKRMRSQSALLDAVLMKTQPDEKDVKYFKVYTQLIEVERTNLRKLRDELEKETKK